MGYIGSLILRLVELTEARETIRRQPERYPEPSKLIDCLDLEISVIDRSLTTGSPAQSDADGSFSDTDESRLYRIEGKIGVLLEEIRDTRARLDLISQVIAETSDTTRAPLARGR